MGLMEKIEAPTETSAREHLTFRLGQEEYGIDILKVQEIRGYEVPTRIANAPEFVKGVINLRGTIVPIIDLRFSCMGSGCQPEYNALTVTIVLHLGQRIVGVVVDSVSDVLEIPAQNVRAAPDLQCAFDATHLTGLAQMGERMVILLDIQSLLLSPEMGLTN